MRREVHGDDDDDDAAKRKLNKLAKMKLRSSSSTPLTINSIIDIFDFS